MATSFGRIDTGRRVVREEGGTSRDGRHPLIRSINLLAKRLIDIILATAMLILVIPLLLVAALAVKLHDRGPVLFRQQRVGKDGKRFILYKVRTMVPDAEHLVHGLRPQNRREGPLFKLVHDPRVTPVGRFLRAASIDELPQLVNVLRGDMSLVGPRPALPEEVAQFDDVLLSRLHVLPGITGLWQVEARDDPSFESYRQYDLHYIAHWSLALDAMILALTVGAVVRRSLHAVRSEPASAEALVLLD